MTYQQPEGSRYVDWLKEQPKEFNPPNRDAIRESSRLHREASREVLREKARRYL
jgi:hypothetical protein